MYRVYDDPLDSVFWPSIHIHFMTESSRTFVLEAPCRLEIIQNSNQMHKHKVISVGKPLGLGEVTSLYRTLPTHKLKNTCHNLNSMNFDRQENYLLLFILF